MDEVRKKIMLKEIFGMLRLFDDSQEVVFLRSNRMISWFEIDGVVFDKRKYTAYEVRELLKDYKDSDAQASVILNTGKQFFITGAFCTNARLNFVVSEYDAPLMFQ